MEPLSAFPRERAAAVSVVFSDIDDTLTTEGWSSRGLPRSRALFRAESR
jgi:hypothetical protein